MTSSRVELAEVELPAYELDTDQPSVPASTFEARLAAAEAAAAGAGLDALVVYADREHFANMSYLTGFDPRFEEAIAGPGPGPARPRCWSATSARRTPRSCLSGVDVVRYQSFSLVSQDRSASPRRSADILRAAGLGRGRGAAGGGRGLEVLRPGRGGAAGGLDRGARVHRGRAARRSAASR